MGTPSSQSRMFLSTLFLLAAPAITMAQVQFNLTSATCYSNLEAGDINLAMEWTSHGYSGEEGYCFDNHGTGYAVGQSFLTWGGCMDYVCRGRPCEERDGFVTKTWWELEEVQPQCCQDCQGRVIPPNKVVDIESLNDECDTVETSVCKTNTESGVGSIDVTYESGLCCIDSETWASAGTELMEPNTCSTRICVAGRPAQWERTTEFAGGCGCCEYNGQMLHPQECITLADGSEVCCCDGEMVKKLTTSDGEDTDAPIPIPTPNSIPN